MRKRHRFTISLGDNCPYCSIGRIVIKTGKYGRFFACDKYPGCVFAQPIEGEDNDLDKLADSFLVDHGINIPLI